MNVSDIDLDISSLLSGVPSDNVVFYFRAGDKEAPDCFNANGDMMLMGETLAAIMNEYPEIEKMIAHACLCRQ